MFALGIVLLIIISGLCWIWVLSHLTPKRYQKLEEELATSTVWTSQTLLDTFNSYNVTKTRGVYEQRQTVY
ncbi:MAG: hypothetical protein ACQEQ2_02975, partial [Pseudomonadota bacterium]